MHYTISKTNLENIASKVTSENRRPDKAVFALSLSLQTLVAKAR